jgi:hypothetical protein
MAHRVENEAADAFCGRVLDAEDRVDIDAAYARHLALAARRPSPATIGFGFGLAAAALVVLLITTPLGSLAQNFLTIFQPSQFAPIDVSSLGHNGLHAKLLPDLEEFGTFRASSKMTEHDVKSVEQAEQVVGFHVERPSSIPATIPNAVQYHVTGRNEQAFTFSAAKAERSAARRGQKLPAMPAHLDGTTISATVGPIVIQSWGERRAIRSMREGRSMRASDGSFLVVAQGAAPVVRSSGASLAELESYLLAMPGVSPQLAERIRAIGDPASTLPVPFRGDKQTARAVDVGGAQGLAIGDNTGLGAGVLWQKNHKIYGVFGTLTEDEVLAVANGLH